MDCAVCGYPIEPGLEFCMGCSVPLNIDWDFAADKYDEEVQAILDSED